MPRSPADPSRPDTPDRPALKRYWRWNLWLMGGLLFVWALASFGLSILLADQLSDVRWPGTAFPIGFWFAQQGSILCFLMVVLIYCVIMNRLDDRHHRDVASSSGEDGSDPQAPGGVR